MMHLLRIALAAIVLASPLPVAAQTGLWTPLSKGGTGGSLADPDADAPFMWDDSEGAPAFLSMPAAGLAISGTGLVLTNDLSALEALASTGFAVRTGSDTWAQRSFADVSNETSWTNPDGVSGNPSVSLDPEIACPGGLTSAADKFVYYTGSGTCALGDVTGFARSLLDDSDAATARTTLGLAIGSDVQAWDDDLEDLAALSPTKGNIVAGDGTDFDSLGVGSNGQCLTAQSGETTGLLWASCGGAGNLPGDPNFDAVLLWDDTTDNMPEWHNYADAFNAIKQVATTDNSGVSEFATTAETEARSSSSVAVTPAGLNTFARIKTGSYTGDGSTSQSITGIGFQPKYVRIWRRETSDTSLVGYETTDTIIDDNASGGAIGLFSTGLNFRDNTIISLDADGFTIDDSGTNTDPNASGVVYNFMVLG